MKNLKLTRITLSLVVIFAGGGPAWAQDTPIRDPWESWNAGIAALEAGEKETAPGYFREAALAWSAQGSTPKNFYNAGLAWTLAGQPARGMFGFHHALKVDPFQGDAAFNLRKLREEEKLESPPWDPGILPLTTATLWISGATLTALALFLMGRRFSRFSGKKAFSPGILLILSAGVISAALGVGVPLRAELRIVAGTVLPRTGDGLYYTGVGTEPWKPGQEALALESRDGWVRLKTQVREGWVQESYLLQP